MIEYRLKNKTPPKSVATQNPSSNQDFIQMGMPKSLFLPGSSYWKKKSSFSSKDSIVNFDNVLTSKKGSTITLNATKNSLGSGIMLRGGTLRMSSKNDRFYIKSEGVSFARESGSSAAFLLQETSGKPSPILDLGNGRNVIDAGHGWDNGIVIAGQLLSGTGNDFIRGFGKSSGISVGGLISTGAGHDIIEGSSEGSGGIYVRGRIEMGAGNDRLTGIAKTIDLSTGAIYSNGWIDMGDGNDKITGTSFMINGAAVGQAKLVMGRGDDNLIATLHHSNAPIDFGDGIDRLFLPSGQYEITDLGGGAYSLLSTGANQGVYGAEKISSLEFIVSKSTGAEYAFATGTLTVA